MLRLHTFGGLQIERDQQVLHLSTQKARELLAYLLTFRDRPHPRPVLAGILWPNLPEDKARRRLSDALWRARRQLGDHLQADEDRLWFNTRLPFWLDAQEFEDHLRPVLEQEQPADLAAEQLTTCIQLYRGPFLDGFFHDWVLLERERLRVLYLEALRFLLQAHKQNTNYGAALEIAQRLASAEPLHEAAHRELMRLYHLLQRDAEAVAQYHRCREILQQELGVAPAPETEELYQLLRSPVGDRPAEPVRIPVPTHLTPAELDQLPLTGRQPERIALLKHLEVAAAGRGGMVLLEGEVGIGKTRLTEEIIAGARWRNINVIQVGAGETDSAPYTALLKDALVPILTPLRLRQLAQLMSTTHLQALTPLFPSIKQTLTQLPSQAELSPPQAREQLQQALIELVVSLSCIGPYLWVLEDLQWADGETLSLLPRLLPQLENHRVLFLLTGRSVEMRANPDVWGFMQDLDRSGPIPRYSLDRLTESAINTLLQHLLGHEDPAAAEALASASEGVPLYLVETLKAWRDEGSLFIDEGQNWQWRGAGVDLPPLPVGTAVISHRLSSLSSAAQKLLDAAAVIGTKVDWELFSWMCSTPSPETQPSPADTNFFDASDELLRLGFLTETETGHRFSHEQVRQTVYRRLSRAQKERHHIRVAQGLEILSPTRFRLLAHHFSRGGLQEPAIKYLILAAERARKLFAHQDALACYHRLLDLLDRPDDRARRFHVLQSRAEVLGWLGDRQREASDLEEMLAIAQALADDTLITSALNMRSEWHRTQGNYQPAVQDALAAIEIHRHQGDQAAEASLLNQLGWNVVYSVDYSQASGYFQQALSLYQQLDDIQGQIRCLSGLMSAAELAGDYSQSMAWCQQCMNLAQESGDPHSLGSAHFSLGLKRYDFGELEAAADQFRHALALSETTGDRRQQAAIYFYLGEVATEARNSKTAQAQLNTALEIFQEVQDLSWEGDALAALGRLALTQSQYAAAKELLESAYQRRRELSEPAYAVLDLSYLALVETELGDLELAWQHSCDALTELKAGLEGVEHPYRIYYNHFRVASATRHWAAGRRALQQAAHIIEKWLARISDPGLREKFRTGYSVRRAIASAMNVQPPAGQLLVKLAHIEVPAHRRPEPDELVSVNWMVDAGPADADLAKRENKVALRRHRLLRLLGQAEAANAIATIADLAGALEVSARTIRTDLATLRSHGRTIRTQGTQG